MNACEQRPILQTTVDLEEPFGDVTVSANWDSGDDSVGLPAQWDEITITGKSSSGYAFDICFESELTAWQQERVLKALDDASSEDDNDYSANDGD